MKHEGQTVLQVFLKQGQPLILLLPRQEAFGILEWWKRTPALPLYTEGATQDGANYCLKAEEIAALVVVPYQPQQAPQQVPPPVPSRQPPFGTIQFPGARA